jgi:choline transport protein
MADLVRRGSKISTDSDTLALLGKKQVLKRRFGFWSLFAFAVCELITWETVLALFAQGLDNGGPAGLIYGFIIAWLSTLFVKYPQFLGDMNLVLIVLKISICVYF